MDKVRFKFRFRFRLRKGIKKGSASFDSCPSNGHTFGASWRMLFSEMTMEDDLG